MEGGLISFSIRFGIVGHAGRLLTLVILTPSITAIANAIAP